MEERYERLAWHYTEDRALRIRRNPEDRFAYDAERQTATGWIWIAQFCYYTIVDYRVIQGRLTDDEMWAIVPVCREEYNSRPLCEK